MSVVTASAEIEDEILTPTVRRSLRKLLFWIITVVVVLGVGIVIMLIERAADGGGALLDPDSAAPQGARAVVEVLRDQGVEVVRSSSLEETGRLLAGREGTVLLRDAEIVLDEEQLGDLLALSSHLVVLNPGLLQADALAPGVARAGSLSSTATTLTADCVDPLAERAGTVRVDGTGLRILDEAGDMIGCFPAENADAVALVRATTDGTLVDLLGPEELLRNDRIVQEGNAALALGLLGEDALLVWYEPGIDDLRAGALPPTMEELGAAWTTPLAILIVLLIIVAGFWQGRRFGPLVVERLPVEVRARETMEGRARLYARSDARGHALDAIRIGTSGRLAERLGLPRSSGPAELVAAVVALTGRPRDGVEALLRQADPVNDAQLAELSDELRLLEEEVARLTGAAPTASRTPNPASSATPIRPSTAPVESPGAATADSPRKRTND